MANNAALQKSEQASNVARPEATWGTYFSPRVDILEKEDELLLCADMPGVKPDDLDLRFENGELILHGRCSSRQKDVKYALCEYGIGDFYRAFTISHEIDSNKITAELKQGVLTVHLPKSEAVKPKRITVKGG